MKRQGKTIPRSSTEECCIFPGALGKYVKTKSIPLVIQQQIIPKISKDEIDLYNNVYVDYMKSKRRFNFLDETIQAQILKLEVHYDRNDAPLSKMKYRYSEVKEDVNSLLNKMRNHRGSFNNIPLNFNQADFAPIERRGGSSLIPFRFSFGSNLSNVGGATSEKALRRSDLLKDFGNLNKESTIFKNSNLDFAQMLDFFHMSGSNSAVAGNRVSLGSLIHPLPSFTEQPHF
jgi:hypothetical protein